MRLYAGTTKTQFIRRYFYYDSDSFSTVFLAFCTNLPITGARLGVRAGEHKSSDGNEILKFPLNFPRKYTPTDVKPFVTCWAYFYQFFFFLFINSGILLPLILYISIEFTPNLNASSIFFPSPNAS